MEKVADCPRKAELCASRPRRHLLVVDGVFPSGIGAEVVPPVHGAERSVPNPVVVTFRVFQATLLRDSCVISRILSQSALPDGHRVPGTKYCKSTAQSLVPPKLSDR